MKNFMIYIDAGLLNSTATWICTYLPPHPHGVKNQMTNLNIFKSVTTSNLTCDLHSSPYAVRSGVSRSCSGLGKKLGWGSNNNSGGRNLLE